MLFILNLKRSHHRLETIRIDDMIRIDFFWFVFETSIKDFTLALVWRTDWRGPGVISVTQIQTGC